MSVSDYIHPSWGESARRIRQFFREISDSKGPRGVESHQLWCDNETIMADGRCEGCNAMRRPVVHRPYVTQPAQIGWVGGPVHCKNCSAWTRNESEICHDCERQIPPIMRMPKQIEAPRSYREDIVRSRHLQAEMERKVAAAKHRSEEMRREIERTKATIYASIACQRCGARTNNVSGLCHRCKVRVSRYNEQKREIESQKASHVAMYTGDGKVVSHGAEPVSTQCPTCSAIYYLPGPCPWCQLALKPLDSGNDT